jgi:hypothetical protein
MVCSSRTVGPILGNTTVWQSIFTAQEYSESSNRSYLSTYIEPPYSDEKADSALAYSMREPEIRRIGKALDTAGRFLSPMTGTLTKLLAMACGVEVKQADGKSMEAKAQLAK